MSQGETTGRKKGKRYHFELSRTSIFLWSTGLFVLLAWIFTLGVLAGRGLLPGGVKTLAELKIQIAKLQQMISKKDRSELEQIRELQKDQKFTFFDELSVKKTEAVKTQSPLPEDRAKSARERKAPKGNGAVTRFVVQVASLDSKAKATEMVKRLSGQGYPAYYYKVFIKGHEYYRVRCGTFKTEEEAINTKRRLAEKEKLSGFVKKVEVN
ncbi:MAG: SPOR domain-containing protein [Desulfobacteraceae bacterium]|nr:SPOR domain-containing protein [Desulfobacterales bacterium]MBL6967628.1 SPOR domain-containing protein [Desulfobacteraceae bacterium]MBL7101969.1 SPOR domain-containing protein [Desulfobacteraceae bacterium]MBU0732612.1 SPOR domain-containing protein [Pseudomonadota bacterium]